MAKPDINIDEVINIAADIIPDPPPKTVFGHIRHWLIKMIKIKKTLGIKIK